MLFDKQLLFLKVYLKKQTRSGLLDISSKASIIIFRYLSQQCLNADPWESHLVREPQQLDFVRLNSNLAISGWVGPTYDH